jgi:hypothetical protein
VLQQEGLQTEAEGTSHLQDWRVECKDLESRKTGKFEKVDAEECTVCSR